MSPHRDILEGLAALAAGGMFIQLQSPGSIEAPPAVAATEADLSAPHGSPGKSGNGIVAPSLTAARLQTPSRAIV